MRNSVVVSNKDGRPGILRTLVLLQRIADECDRRAPTDPQLGAAGTKARQAAQNLGAADQRVQELTAAGKLARYVLCESYDQADLIARQLQALLFALYGTDEEALAPFGVKPLRTRKPKVAKGSGTTHGTAGEVQP
jgi:hypothetical protein